MPNGDEMKKIALSLIFICGTANASNWQVVGVGATASALVDANSISRSGKYKKAWVKYSFAADQEASVMTNFKKWRSSTDLIYFSCEERTSGTVQATYYDGIMSNGEVVASMNLKLSQVLFSEAAPDTLGEAVLEFACGKSQADILGLARKK
jgi:hypothetical protein